MRIFFNSSIVPLFGGMSTLKIMYKGNQRLMSFMSYCLQIMSNGKYKSIEHRVTISCTQERLTISAFHIPLLDGILWPVKSTTEDRIQYKSVAVEEYAKLYMSNKLDGKRALDHAKLF